MNFYKINNADGKQWIMPSRNMSMGMLLYQPLAWKGRLLKKYFPILNRLDILGVIRKGLHIESCDNPIPDVLDSKLKNLFNEEELEYSVFNGTPCAHQKVTIQIYKGEKILGYCKWTDNPDLIEIFQREESYLDWLKERKVDGVPECLCCQEIEAGKWIFVQSTIKSSSSNVLYSISNLEVDFLKQLSAKTVQNMPFPQTDMFVWLKKIENTELRKIQEICKSIKIVEDYYCTRDTFQFSAYHSDFTPWNMFVENGRLFVFDWEYAGRAYIPYLDIIHYLMQTSIFERKADSSTLFSMLFVDNRKMLDKYFTNPHIAVLFYLLDILSKYESRDEEHETKDTIMLRKERLELVNLVLMDYLNGK